MGSCCCCFCLLGWKLGAWRRKLGARTRVRRGTTSSTLTFSSNSHRSEGPSPICALNRIRVSQSQTEGNRSRRSEVRPYPPPEMRSTNKLEKSRQSARECRARKKLRYQYLDDMILEREKANDALREELTKYVGWCQMLDQSQVPDGLQELLTTTPESWK